MSLGKVFFINSAPIRNYSHLYIDSGFGNGYQIQFRLRLQNLTTSVIKTTRNHCLHNGTGKWKRSRIDVCQCQDMSGIYRPTGINTGCITWLLALSTSYAFKCNLHSRTLAEYSLAFVLLVCLRYGVTFD